METPREVAESVEAAELPGGPGERFVGYGIMAQPFSSGHILALRRFPVSSIGPGYTMVWHCAPSGRWRMWSEAKPMLSCPRYFGPALEAVVDARVEMRWADDWTLEVTIPGILAWKTTFAATPATRMLNAIAARLPQAAWHDRRVLSAMARIAGRMLGAGELRFVGKLPSEQSFEISPRKVWVAREVSAALEGVRLGPPGPVHPQRWLGDFALVNRGLFATGNATFEPLDPARHRVIIPEEVAPAELSIPAPSPPPA